MHYGLIGRKLDHSFSPGYFTSKFRHLKLYDHVYSAFPLTEIEAFPKLLERYPEIAGLNVTIPYKTSIIPFLDELSETAKEINAVNTIAFNDGKLVGHNTDAPAFAKSLQSFLPKITNALVLGSGGASKAVQFALHSLNIPFWVVSRNINKSKSLIYSNLNNVSSYSLIINCTPLGTYPEVETCPDIPYETLRNTQILYDLVYNPNETVFLQKGKVRGCTVKNGEEMLFLQAEMAWEIWQTTK
jgi:shikimate dehydrogenase